MSSEGSNSDLSESRVALHNSEAPATGGGAATPAKKRRRRSRATYHMRKDEIQGLQTRMEELELELKALRFQALVQSSSSSSSVSNDSRSHSAKPASQPQVHTAAKSHLTRHLLRDAIKSQQFALAGLQAMLSKYSSLQETSPLHAGIRLPSAFDKRREALLAARDATLQDARRFILLRSEGMDPRAGFHEQERFETPSGDFCVSSFKILPLPRAGLSVKRAFETFYFFIQNVEISFSELIGHITIRENEEHGSAAPDAKFLQHRLVATVASTTAQVETNVVTFSEFQSMGEGDGDDSQGVGIIVVDSIDHDELYPYHPSERVRRDTSGVFLFQGHPSTDDETGVETQTVVLTGWSLSRLHASALLENDLRATQEVRASIGTWGEKLMQALYEASLSAVTGSQVHPERATDMSDGNSDSLDPEPLVDQSTSAGSSAGERRI